MNIRRTACVGALLIAAWCTAGVVSAQDLILPDYWDDGLFGGSWVFYNQCPFDIEDWDPPAHDPDLVYGFRFTMLDLDYGDDFYFTGFGLPWGFGWDSWSFDVLIDGEFQGFVWTGDRGWAGEMPPEWFYLGFTKSFEILGTPDIFIDPWDPDDQRIFPVWLNWWPHECGADFAMTPLYVPEPTTLALVLLGSLGLARQRRQVR